MSTRLPPRVARRRTSAATDPDRDLRFPDHAAAEEPDRPDRPASIELAAALVLVNAIFRLVVIALAATQDPPVAPIAPLELLVELALQIGLVVVSLLVRAGRAWVVAINVLAVVAFVQAFGLSAVGLSFALLYGLAFILVFRARAWFDAMTRWRAATARRAELARRP